MKNLRKLIELKNNLKWSYSSSFSHAADSNGYYLKATHGVNETIYTLFFKNEIILKITKK